jgi:hypothetical protein
MAILKDLYGMVMGGIDASKRWRESDLKNLEADMNLYQQMHPDAQYPSEDLMKKYYKIFPQEQRAMQQQAGQAEQQQAGQAEQQQAGQAEQQPSAIPGFPSIQGRGALSGLEQQVQGQKPQPERQGGTLFRQPQRPPVMLPQQLVYSRGLEGVKKEGMVPVGAKLFEKNPAELAQAKMQLEAAKLGIMQEKFELSQKLGEAKSENDKIKIQSLIDVNEAKAKQLEAQAKVLEMGGGGTKPSWLTNKALKAKEKELNRPLSDQEQYDIGMTTEGQKAEVTSKQRTLGAQDARKGLFTPDAIDYIAHSWMQTGQMPPMGLGGYETRSAIFNRVAEIAKQTATTPEQIAEKQSAFKALSAELKNLDTRKGQVLSFANTAESNLKIVEELSGTVDRTGIPVVNRWLLAGKKSLAGDPDVAKLNAAVTTAINEYAKVTSSATGGGVTSDQARKEIQDILELAQTPEQVQSVVDILKREMNNRREGFAKEEQVIRAGLQQPATGGQGGGQGTSDTGTKPPLSQEEAMKAGKALGLPGF